MKKVLSVILAVMMIAACVPMAFAEGECKHAYDVYMIMNEGYDNCEKCGVKSADFTECFKAYVKFAGKAYSIANSKVDNEAIFSRVKSDVEGFDTTNLHCATSEDQAYVDAVTKSVNEYVERLSEEFIFYFDATDLITAVYKVEALDLDDVDVEMFSAELLEETLNAFKEYIDIIEGRNNGDTVDLEEGMEKGKIATYYYTSVVSCIDGNHKLEVFTDNGDGTHSADCMFCNTKDVVSEHEWGEYVTADDGSKTAECKYCDATDTDNFEKDIRDFFKMLINLIKSFIEAIMK